jgi:predicted transcriptional regulator
MPRLLITITDEMDAELRQIAEKRSAPLAALVREAIEEWLERRGREVKSDVVWGRRPTSGETSSKENEEGQLMAVAAN